MEKQIQRKAIKAGIYVSFYYGLSQIFRLIGNLILTRILIPEHFGIMTLANTFIMGLNLFSDLGIEPAVIRSSRASEEDFLNTAWTIQIIRGSILTLVAFAIAYPIAVFYKQPIITWILPVIGLSSFVMGLNSTQLITLNRELKQGTLTLIELIAQVLSLTVMIFLAYRFRSIWALVIGGIVPNIVRAIWSHCIPQNHRNRFQIDKEAIHEILSFGKWIFIATAAMFLASQFDKFYLGKVFPIAILGVYGIATMFADIPKSLFSALSGKVLFPVFNTYKDSSKEDMRNAIHRPRKILLLLLALMISAVAAFGDYLIIFLYDERYHQAAWMLPVLALGTWPHLLHSTNGTSLSVIGKPQYNAYGYIAKLIYMLIVLPFISPRLGVFGIVIAVALNDIPIYSVINYGLYRNRLSALKQDLFVTVILFAVTAFLLFIRLTLGLQLPGLSSVQL